MPKLEPYPGENPAEALERITKNIEDQGIPTSNAMERSESYAMGGEVTPMYKKGGKV